MDIPKEELEELERYDKTYQKGIRQITATHDYTDLELLHQQLIARIRKYHPNADISLVERAYTLAYEAHKEQYRKSGEPYISHPLSVALILADLEMDQETLAAGLLHDVIEDTSYGEDFLRKEFGDEVVNLVLGVTKLKKLDRSAQQNLQDKTAMRLEIQAENLRKMFLAMAKDIRVIIIKLADRLHNMRTLQFQSEEGQKRIASETQDIYCPLAQRLGISKIKIELEDISMKYLYPEAYYNLVKTIAATKADRDGYINGLADMVRREVTDAGIKAEVYGRAKHFFSIYKKMVNQHKEINQIYDLFAIRIIVDSIKDCYAALGIMHAHYKPIPGRFKDYIAMPKQNMYQSLHTTLIGPTGEPFEVQIRTYEMHRTAEYGIAAHWKYKEANNGNATSTTVTEEEKLSWLRQILEWQQDATSNQEFMSFLKSDLDLFTESVFAFTPSGDVKNLPKGSTTIDFAYAIHSAVGNKMVGAKVNGRMVPIDYEIQNGDQIEIITSPISKGPSRDWLKIVKSPQAKNKINQFYRAMLREENIQRGKDLLAIYAKNKGLVWSDLNRTEYQKRIIQKYGFQDWNNCLATIGHGSLKEASVVNRMYDEWQKDHPVQISDSDVIAGIEEKRKQNEERTQNAEKKTHSGIIVRGLDDVSVYFPKCCNPVPGDDIIGFVTRGRGVSIHRRDCVNVTHISEEDKARLIQADWQADAFKTGGEYGTQLRVYAVDRPGLLVDIAKVFSEIGISIGGISSSVSKQGVATLELSFKTKGKQEMTAIVGKIRQIEGVLDVERV